MGILSIVRGKSRVWKTVLLVSKHYIFLISGGFVSTLDIVLIYSQTIVNFPQNLELVGVNCNRVKAVLFEEPLDA